MDASQKPQSLYQKLYKKPRIDQNPCQSQQPSNTQPLNRVFQPQQPLNIFKREDIKFQVKNECILGAILTAKLHRLIQCLIDQNDGKIQENQNKNQYQITGGINWIEHTSCLAKYIADGNKKNAQTQSLDYILKVGEAQTKMRGCLNIERLFLEENISLLIRCTDINENRKDLSYAEIKRIIESLKRIDNNLSDASIAEILLRKVKNGESSNFPQAERKCPGISIQLNHFLNFVNALLFGMEASRNNLCFGTSLMTLELIRDRITTFQQAFDTRYETLTVGLYPMALVKPENVDGHYRLSTKGQFYQMQPEQQKQHLEKFIQKCLTEQDTGIVALREMWLVIKWLEFKERCMQEKFSTMEPVNAITKLGDFFLDLLHRYYCRPLAVPQSLIPEDNSQFNYGFSGELILNGMKVIFDQPIGVYPVTLESKDEAHRNGT
ncbi:MULTISPECIES: hypothetical protein [unclassified Tolypothrix]|uniref:hypothetical protein n=1 Tax=unclassified Tolypothrix TaxID=2649714 RepID=UPI0005EAC6CC|nr:MULTISPECIES: hypothetical protein [unclassified Tolypothrix]BAY95256.1 hypothetical protein NIES3275_73130 [Microchaete diplosiphon NIES-3275]EKE98121.1 hypothetical protein FDUTEX481_04268 [Tolypothrix sp. PCC 7601]MBE9085996.1 hypothetical protein [Tolypothrix sp. LEGE 11397]UYD30481.1 hypothetical protein HGR01_37225 [Tolypothrix sp. PCC 7712]UYD38385.1 hypothetical protein HG267_37670 [Tolypothrix sp. PCC 7601]